MLARIPLVALALSAAASVFTVAGCGADTSPPMPAAVLGTYDVDVEANGKTDHTIMTITQGSNQNVLLNFTMGISTVRCQMIGATQLVLPRQTIRVQHASGIAEGNATGMGTITTEGAVDLIVQLSTVGFATDAGVNGAVEYHFTGQRQ